MPLHGQLLAQPRWGVTRLETDDARSSRVWAVRTLGLSGSPTGRATLRVAMAILNLKRIITYTVSLLCSLPRLTPQAINLGLQDSIDGTAACPSSLVRRPSSVVRRLRSRGSVCVHLHEHDRSADRQHLRRLARREEGSYEVATGRVQSTPKLLPFLSRLVPPPESGSRTCYLCAASTPQSLFPLAIPAVTCNSLGLQSRRPSMPPTPIPSHAHPYYHQSPHCECSVKSFFVDSSTNFYCCSTTCRSLRYDDAAPRPPRSAPWIRRCTAAPTHSNGQCWPCVNKQTCFKSALVCKTSVVYTRLVNTHVFIFLLCRQYLLCSIECPSDSSVNN